MEKLGQNILFWFRELRTILHHICILNTYIHRQKLVKNLVVLNGKEVDPSDFMQEVVDGFSDMYKNALDKKKEIINLLKVFENLNVRYLVQDTQRYTMVLHTSFHQIFCRTQETGNCFCPIFIALVIGFNVMYV